MGMLLLNVSRFRLVLSLQVPIVRKVSSFVEMNISKFEGCLLGALLGDCLGEPFEDDGSVSRVVLHKYIDDLQKPDLKIPYKPFTDDTVMTHAIAEMFVSKRKFDENDLARRFVNQFTAEPWRGYGGNVVTTFRELKKSKFSDVYGPASMQFNGDGSWGNGAAMRVSPVALVYHSNYDKMLSVARDCSRITHTNQLGINGALLQCIAVNKSLHCDPGKPLDVFEFLADITDKMKTIEASEEEANYCKRLSLIKKLLEKDPQYAFEESVVEILGNNIAALNSVPTALYCFLRAQKPLDHIQTDNQVRRTVELSISLGGDTDTIATMAGAMVGAQLGKASIDSRLLAHCEGVQHSTNLAQQLYELAKAEE